MQPRAHTAIWVVILAGIVAFAWLYWTAIGPYWEITPDGAAYMDGAEQLAAGERYTAPLHPPVTSMLYAIPVAFGVEDYWWFNALTAAASLLAMVPVYLLFKRLIGPLPAGAIVLLSLASAHLFRYSTILLSESFYLLFSMAAMLFVFLAKGSRRPWRVAAAALFVLTASMTRMIGFVLPLAVIAEQLWPFGGRWQAWWRANWMLILAMAFVLAADVAWELRNARTHFSPAQLALHKEPWSPVEGVVSTADLARRVYSNAKGLGLIGSALANWIELKPARKWETAVMASAGLALFAVGLAGRLRRPMFLDLYIVFSLATFCIYWTEIMYRWLAPLIPLLWFYVWLGMLRVWSWTQNGRSVLRPLLAGMAGVWIALYVLAGARQIRSLGAEARTTPIDGSAIKYAANYDLQRAVMWLRERPGGPGVLLCQHYEIARRLTGEPAVPFPFSQSWEAWREALERAEPRYALADKRKFQVLRYLIPMAEEHPEVFRHIREYKDVRVYAVDTAATGSSGLP